MYDFIVIGAGIVGSWTAYHLAKSGHSTALIDQFSLPHTRGSSHGQSRIFRIIDQNPAIQKMAANSLRKHWQQLQLDSNEELLVKSGRLNIARERAEVFSKWNGNAANHCIPIETVSNIDLKEKYHLNYPDNHIAIYEKDSMVMKAQKCLDSVQREFKKFSGEIIDNCTVTELILDGSTDSVFISTTKGNFEASKIISCMGAWTKNLFPRLNLPLKPEAIAVCYWKLKDPNTYSLENGFPNLSHTSEKPVYAVPAFEYPGLMKVSYHGGPNRDAENRDTADQRGHIDYVKKYVHEYLPGLESDKPVIVEHCMYTWTPDKVPIMDYHPAYSNVIIGAGFSGGGFKLSPEAGKILSYLALDKAEELDYDLKQFSIERFKEKSHL